VDKGYEPALDGVRALAALAVLTLHAMPQVMLGGYLGVDVFFVLSGYLITSILLREVRTSGRIDYARFLTRRARRLFPALAVLIIYLTLFANLSPALADRRWFDAAIAALYLTNIRELFWSADTPLSHTWSLAVEQQFYLLWPFAVLALARMTHRAALRTLIVGWIVLTCARTMAALLWPGWVALCWQTPLHATGLVMGAMLALTPWRPRRGRSAIGALSLAALLALLLTASDFRYGFPLAEIAAALLIASPPRILAIAPLRWGGAISYGVYLWQLPVLWMLRDQPLALQFAMPILLGAASYMLVERRFMPERAAGARPAGPAPQHEEALPLPS